MKGKIYKHKAFLAIFGIYALPFTIIFFTDYLVRITKRKQFILLLDNKQDFEQTTHDVTKHRPNNKCVQRKLPWLKVVFFSFQAVYGIQSQLT